MVVERIMSQGIRLAGKPAEFGPKGLDAIGTVLRVYKPLYQPKTGLMIFRQPGHADIARGVLNNGRVTFVEELGANLNSLG